MRFVERDKLLVGCEIVAQMVFVIHLQKRQFCCSNEVAYRVIPVNQDCLVLFHVVTSFGLTA